MKKQLLFILFVLSGMPLYAQMAGWSHVQPISVHEHSEALVTDYQLQIELNTQTLVTLGEMLTDGSDIRFSTACNGGTEFPYWIESGMNTATTKIWVKIDTLQASQIRTIYMHYGNSSATAVSSVNGTFVGPHSATDSVSGGSPGGVTNSQRGFRFEPTEDLLLTAFGKNEPNGSERYITLFDYASQAILQQMQVSGPAAQYTYGNLPSPIWLVQSTQYLLEMYQGDSDGYSYGVAPQMGQHLQYYDMRYCNGCNQNTFPGNYLNNMHYGYPDFWYFTKNNVTPAPTYSFDPYIVMLEDSIGVCVEDTIELPMPIGGGTTPFTFNWTGSDVISVTTQNLQALATNPGMYYVSVTDGCGYTVIDSVEITINPLPVASISSTFPLICNGEYSELIVSGEETYSYEWNDASTNDTLIVTPSSSTNYSLIATTIYGCQDEFVYEQAVNVPVLATQDITICTGQNFIVDENIYDSTGTYIDTIAGITICDSIITTNLTIEQLPTATYNVTICFGTSYNIGQHEYAMAGTYTDTIPGAFCDSIITTVLTIEEDIDAQAQAIGFTLVADLGGDSYQWVDCNNNNTPIAGATGTIYEVTANGSYAALVTVNNCTKLTNCITVATIGLEENDLIENISVYPNPNNGTFTVQSSVTQTVRLSDALGNTVREIEVLAGQPQTIELEKEQSGIYFLVSRTRVVRLMIK